MGFLDELKSRNFSVYGQWFGIISLILLIVLGGLNFVHNVIFSIVGWVIAFILLFVEIPLLTHCCPTSPRFDNFISYFKNVWLRAILYLIFAVIMFLSTMINHSSLIASGVILLFASICYFVAAFMGQPFASSKVLGGGGVDTMV